MNITDINAHLRIGEEPVTLQARREAEVERLVRFLDPLFLNDTVTQDQRTAIKDAIWIMRGAAAGAYESLAQLDATGGV